jgi:putative hydrolase of the HAD superfamily
MGRVIASLPPPEALLIDLNDTLIDARGTYAEAIAALDSHVAGRYGTEPGALTREVDPVLDELWPSQPFGDDFRRLGCARSDALWVEFAGPGDLLREIREWMPRFRQQFWSSVCARAGARGHVDHEPLGAALLAERLKTIRTFAGVTQALDSLRQRFRLALLTNGPGDLQRRKLSYTSLDRYFDAVVISAEVGVAKPRPEIFELALHDLRSTPARTLMVGDDWQQDVLGARAVGLGVVWVAPRPEHNEGTVVDDTRVIERFADLPSALGIES